MRRRRLPLVLILVAATALVGGQAAVVLWGGGGQEPQVVACPPPPETDLICEDARARADTRLRGTEAALETLARRRPTLPDVATCHHIAHAIGEASAARDGVGALGGGSPLCWSGYSHGVADALAAADGVAALEAALPGVCAGARDRAAETRCARMAGRGLSALHDGDPVLALSACAVLPAPRQDAACFAGALAEEAVASRNPVHPGLTLPRQGPSPCATLPDDARGRCAAEWRGSPA